MLLHRCVEPFASVLRSRCFDFPLLLQLALVLCLSLDFGKLEQLVLFSYFFFSFTFVSLFLFHFRLQVGVLTMHSSRGRLRANGPASLLSDDE